MSDDFLAILNFSLEWSAQPHGLARVLEVIASQHNEYKLVVEHALVASDLALTGRLHFGPLIWAGNLMLLGIGWLLWEHLAPERDPTLRLLLFAPAAWLLFQLNFVENLDWAMCGLQTMPVLLFTLLSLHFLLKKHRGSLLVAASCAVLGCLSSGNGFLMAPAGLFLLLASRRFRAAVLWMGAYALALSLYLYRYHRFLHPEYAHKLSFPLRAQFFLSFVGAAAENMHHQPFPYASVGLGLVILCAFAFAWRTGFAHERPFLFWMAVWCLLTAGVVTEARLGEGVVVALTLRYKVYSDLLLIFCYGLGVSRIRASRFTAAQQRGLYLAAALAAVLLASVSDVFGYRFLMKRQRYTEQALIGFTADQARKSPEIGADGFPVSDARSVLDRRILLRCIREGIYTIPGRL